MRCGYLFCVERLTFEHLLIPEQWYGNWTSKFRLPGESIMVNSTRWNVIATTCTVGWLKMGWGLLVQSPLLKFLLILGLSIQIFYANFDFCLEKISVAAFLNFNQLCGIALITIGCVVRVRPPTKIDTKTQKIQILIIKAIFRDNYMTTGNEWFVGVLFRLFFYL